VTSRQSPNPLFRRLVRLDPETMDHDKDLVWDRHGLEVLSVSECWSLLEHSVIGRVAFVNAGEPVILPVTYRLDGHSIVFRSSEGSKLSAASMGAVVGFEVDHYDLADRTGWSVVTRGVAERLYDESDVARSGADRLNPWAAPTVDTHPVRVRVWELSGRRIVRGRDGHTGPSEA
jgi:nitroimidazol reductase NimA-like FMN-containing flavoprotein (pyridoxamine 5'-phosphate oxidase superfamily)